MAARAPGETGQQPDPDPGQQPDWQPDRPAVAGRTIAAATLLAAAAISWTAYPLHTGRPGTKITLIAAIAAGVLSSAQLVLLGVPQRSSQDLSSLPERTADGLLDIIRAAPWAEVMIVALLVLEALHPARPWHTALLGVALLAYIFAVHLTETRARPKVLRTQLPLLAAGIGLTALAVGAAALPGLPTGPSATAIRVIAITAAVGVAAIAVPVGGPRD